MPKHILVVDDQAEIRELLAGYFTKRGYHVTTAESEAETLRIANEEPLHLVILDIDLGGVDGLQVLQSLKSAHPALPVIMLTGMGFDDELVQEALAHKASGYVSKTLPLEQLLMEVHRVMKLRQKERA